MFYFIYSRENFIFWIFNSIKLESYSFVINISYIFYISSNEVFDILLSYSESSLKISLITLIRFFSFLIYKFKVAKFNLKSLTEEKSEAYS